MENLEVKILLVDDEEIILTLFKAALQSWGYNVEVASDGQQALQKCSENTFQILITDLNMPNMDGLSLLKRVKDRWPMMEVIVVTGYGTIETAINAMKEGASDFILKPVNFDQVQFTIKKCYQKVLAAHENKELREANAQLRKLNGLKNKFLAITNHEIRTPLTIIKGYLEILSMILESDDQEVNETLEILQRTAGELNETVERMHVLTRANRAMSQVPKKRFDLVASVRSSCENMHGLFKYRAIEFVVDLPQTEIIIEGAVNNIRMIVQELLQNALKFTPDNGKVSIAIAETESEVSIIIEDTGIGIPYEEQALIFTDFYEVQDSINHKTSKAEFMGGGMGIGLSLVKEIVTTMLGRIELDSTPGVGSSFKIYLQKDTTPVPVTAH